MSARIYQYIGPTALKAAAEDPIARLEPRSPVDVIAWLGARKVSQATFTFIVDVSGALWISDRGTEHVACARGKPVLAAGEITLRHAGDAVSVASITNQSTGYCPEPECWVAVSSALSRAGLTAPDGFTHAFSFRRCPSCGTTNLLKAEAPECGVCGEELPAAWNFA
ncbi:Hypothetical protein A7982_10944 [Minicystis rosea]|nr:Hypothetical protein A7982_10944 [Minicystis rosea]